jgi:hypothetical protein
MEFVVQHVLLWFDLDARVYRLHIGVTEPCSTEIP